MLRKSKTGLPPQARTKSAAAQGRARLTDLLRQLKLFVRRPLVRRLMYGVGAVAGVLVLACLALWWRLSSGPIALDLATPWLTAAIEENFGAGYRVDVGGTQLERDQDGRTALRIRNIVVRDPSGSEVARAPKAEVGFSGAGLLTGRLRAERLSLVGAELSVSIDQSGQFTVFAGAQRQPIVTAPAIGSTYVASAVPGQTRAAAPAAPPTPAPAPPVAQATRSSMENIAALLAWIDSLGGLGLDGRDLAEVGLKNGVLKVVDARADKTLTFENINLSVNRPKGGGIAFNVSSETPVRVGNETVMRPWFIRAAMVGSGYARRTVQVEASDVAGKDLLLALRLDEGQLQADVKISAVLNAEISHDGTVLGVAGRIVAEGGSIGEINDEESQIPIERAEFSLDWDSARRALLVPFHVRSGANRITLLAQLDPPRDASSPWMLGLTGGTVVLGSVGVGDDDPSIVLERVAVRARFDPVKRRIDLDQGDFRTRDLGIRLSGSLDYSGAEPRLALGMASTRMNVATMKRIWPPFVAPAVRTWVLSHVVSGSIERVDIATNAPMHTLKASGPPVPDNGLSIEVAAKGATIRPVDGLPPIRDADIGVRITGRTATVTVGRGNVEVSPGRRVVLTNGVFEVPDTFPKGPPARVRFRAEGSVPAVAELLAMERLRDASGTPVDPSSSRGNVAANVVVGLPLQRDLPRGATTYTINADITNFSAERMMMGQKVEATTLRVIANAQGYHIRGDVKINGTLAVLDFRKPRGDGDAEVRIQATLDEAARARLGFEVGSAVAGPVPVKLTGRMGASDKESRFAVEADLTQAKIDGLFPGWMKPAGRSVRSSFTLVKQPQGTRFEDLVIEGHGASIKGTVELDASGELASVNFPVFNLADGDKANLKAERASDGTLKVTMRGEVYDGRGFVKTSLSSDQKKKSTIGDLDLDIRIGAVAGFHGETMRGLDLKLSRRAGQIRSFALNAKLGRDTPLIGDLRGRGGGRDVVYFETNDAGALFRFTDLYAKMHGGQMWVALDPPSQDDTAQEGILNVRDFAVRGEAALENIASSAPNSPPGTARGVEFSRMRVDFTRAPGRLVIRDGVVRGPIVGATIDGSIDYNRDDVRMRGTFVPLYGLNNMFGQFPIIGLFLGGGSNEGLVGITYEVVGSPSAPRLNVNPISAVAPGLLRKFFEFPASADTPPQSFR
jgi:hypothetical protein